MRQAGAYSGILTGKKGGHVLPLARIKKMMKKSSVDVKMISGEAPIVFSKACELFIQELTMKSWKLTMAAKRRTLLKPDVASAVAATDLFDFLLDLVKSHNHHHATNSIDDQDGHDDDDDINGTPSSSASNPSTMVITEQ